MLQITENFTVVKRLILLFMTLVVFTFSCYKDVIDLDLKNLEQRIVVEGSITDQSGPYRIMVSRSKAYYEPDVIAPVVDAVIMISDDIGNVELLREGDAGVYWTRLLQGVPGRTYTLTVTVDGVDYVGVSTMPEAIELDTIRAIHVTDEGWDHYELSCSFYDREGVEDFCSIQIYDGNILLENYFFWDKYSDGEYVSIDDFNLGFGEGTSIQINFLTIDKNTYDYWVSLYEDINFDVELPDIIPVAPYNLEGNLSNDALGYFAAHTIRSYDVVIE